MLVFRALIQSKQLNRRDIETCRVFTPWKYFNSGPEEHPHYLGGQAEKQQRKQRRESDALIDWIYYSIVQYHHLRH